jgi:hypothetical protein
MQNVLGVINELSKNQFLLRFNTMNFIYSFQHLMFISHIISQRN